MAGSLWIIAGSVLLLLMSSFAVGQEGQDQRLLISDDDEVPQNPLSLIFVKESSELTIRFGLSFLEELRLLKDSCMSRAAQMEGNFKDALIQLREYQYQTEEILESSGMSTGMSEEQKQYLRERLNNSLNELLDQQDKARKALTNNCSREYQRIINERMRSVLGYANSMLLDGGVETYNQLLNGIRAYGHELQTALSDCIDLYTPYFRRHNNMRGGTTDTLCMITEVQTLIEFIRNFLIRANELLDTGNNSNSVSPTLTDIQHESTLSPSPTPTDNNNNNNHHHHGHHGNHHHGHHHHGHHHHGNHHHGNKHNESDHHGDHHHGNSHHHHHHHGGHHHGGHHHGDNHHGNNHTIGQLHPTPSTHSRPNPTNVHHRPSSSDLPRPHQPSNKPHPHQPSNKPYSHQPSNKPHSQEESHRPHPTAHINVIVQVEPSATRTIIVDPTEQGLSDHHDLPTILIYAGVLSGLFIVSVLIIGGALLCVRYHGNKRKSGWKHLSEEEKVSQMKSSGYVNPTYKFFDQVTQ
ncbi:PREDICTED: protein kinase 4-like isoform X2 [Amphimedon queenslandica]|uniref:Uncharacterized protein n=1 Tax=Amphimedon queenslandica TaxID=400682 RepID=A0AAN0J6M0_AMPQE|nr:PREDICTED: protein kinase 4-like isoform X2 [Amphimedon queenslandica]|eukprot:XP_019852333.1 PREDICTED: protein kinase 4-like isoform X2 [Amphimedon queenslandica]